MRWLGLLAVLGFLLAALAALKPALGWNAHAIAYVSAAVTVFIALDGPYWRRP